MGCQKAPGPVCLNAFFYKKFWLVVGLDVQAMVLGVLSDGNPFPDFNQTNICLVPKKINPQVTADYRPISLCNVIYKIVSKVLVNRLKGVLPGLICPNQSAFVPGRLIFDNSMVAYELVHIMKNRRQGKELMAIKLDMIKAYDRVE